MGARSSAVGSRAFRAGDHPFAAPLKLRNGACPSSGQTMPSTSPPGFWRALSGLRHSLMQYRLYLLAAARLRKSANNCEVCHFNWTVVYLHRCAKSSRPIFSRVTWQSLSFKVPDMRHLKSDGFPQIFLREAPLSWSNPNHQSPRNPLPQRP